VYTHSILFARKLRAIFRLRGRPLAPLCYSRTLFKISYCFRNLRYIWYIPIANLLESTKNLRSVSLTKFCLFPSEVGLETRIFQNGKARFGRTGPTGERGPPLEVNHFFRKISPWTEAFHLCFDRNSRKCWHDGKHPSLPHSPRMM